MSRYIVFAIAVLVLSGALVQSIEHSQMAQTAGPDPAPAQKPRSHAASSTKVVLAARDGHFFAGAIVNSRPLRFVVDTGATLIALRESDANAIGIRPYPDDYKIPVSTANGKSVAAAAELDRVEIGGIEVRGVPALILPDRVLSVNLLGMSFLSRVRWAHEEGTLILEQ